MKTPAKFTVADLLDEDERKELAQKLADGSITELTVIYHDEEDNLVVKSTESIPHCYGDLELYAAYLKETWLDEVRPSQDEHR